MAPSWRFENIDLPSNLDKHPKKIEEVYFSDFKVLWGALETQSRASHCLPGSGVGALSIFVFSQ